MIRTKKLEKILYSAVWAASILAFPLPVYAESELAKQVLKAVSNVSDAIVTILLGLIVLITVISLVRSGLSAQISTQFQKKYGLSREIIMVLETVTIFVLAIIALPVLKKIMRIAISKAGSQSTMLGGDFHLVMDQQEQISISSDMQVAKMTYEDSPLGNVSTEFVYMQRSGDLRREHLLVCFKLLSANNMLELFPAVPSIRSEK